MSKIEQRAIPSRAPASALARTKHGLTLPELLVVLAVLAAATTVALPAASVLARHARVEAQARELFLALHYARGLAATSRRTTVVCAARRRTNGELACGTRWTTGSLVFRDDNRNGDRDASEAIASYTPMDARVSVTWRGFGGGERIRFLPTGQTIAHNGTFTVCAPQSEVYRVIVNRAGRPRMARGGSCE